MYLKTDYHGFEFILLVEKYSAKQRNNIVILEKVISA